MAAEVGGDSGAPKKGKKAGKAHKPKKRPRIDMTPMVDLGFLLLTFFVLTTTMSTPNTMPVVVPPKITEKDKDVEPPKISEKKVITLLVNRGKVYYYVGIENPELRVTDFSPKTGIRKVLLERREEVEANYGKDEMIVIIKMMEEAQYRDFVDILDEMAVINQKKYALVDITPEEKEMVSEYQKTMEKSS